MANIHVINKLYVRYNFAKLARFGRFCCAANVPDEEVQGDEDEHPLPVLALAELLPPDVGVDVQRHALAGGTCHS